MCPYTQSQTEFQFDVRNVTSGWNDAPIWSESWPTSHPSEWGQRWLAQGKFQVFHLWQGPTWGARRRRTSARIPEGSWLAVRLNTSPSEMEGNAANWQTVNSSLASSSTNHTGLPRGANAKEGYLTDVCSLHFKQAIFWVQKAERKWSEIHKIDRSQYPGVWEPPSFPNSPCLASPPLSCPRTAILTH